MRKEVLAPDRDQVNWPGILVITGAVWVFVASPEWRKKNWENFWPWPRDNKKDDK